MEQYQSGEARWSISGSLVASTVASGTGTQDWSIDDPPEPPPEKKA